MWAYVSMRVLCMYMCMLGSQCQFWHYTHKQISSEYHSSIHSKWHECCACMCSCPCECVYIASRLRVCLYINDYICKLKYIRDLSCVRAIHTTCTARNHTYTSFTPRDVRISNTKCLSSAKCILSYFVLPLNWTNRWKKTNQKEWGGNVASERFVLNSSDFI